MSWNQCPHCKGSTFEPGVKPKQWCKFCLPIRHPSGLNVSSKDLSVHWHRDRGQKPGYVTDARLVEFVLFQEEMTTLLRQAELL